MARTKKTTEAVAEAVVETVEKKAAAPRKTTKTTVCVEMNGLNVSVADIQSAVKKAVKANGQSASELNIYINAQEKAAYYTLDGVGSADYKVDLTTL